MRNFPEKFLHIFFAQRGDYFYEFNYLNALCIFLLVDRRNNSFIPASNNLSEPLDLYRKEGRDGAYYKNTEYRISDLHDCQIDRAILPQDSIQHFTQKVKEGLCNKFLVDLPLLIKKANPEFNIVLLNPRKPIYSFQGNIFRRLDWIDGFISSNQNTNFSYPGLGLCVYGAHWDAEFSSWVFDYWRIYGDHVVLDYIDYVLYWNLCADLKKTPPPLAYTGTSMPQPDCYDQDHFIDIVIKPKVNKKALRMSFPLTNEEIAYLEFYDPRAPANFCPNNIICLNGENVKDVMMPCPLTELASYTNEYFPGLCFGATNPENEQPEPDLEQKEFLNDYQKSANTDNFRTILITVNPLEKYTFLRKYVNDEFGCMPIGAEDYLQMVKDIGSMPMNTFSNLFPGEFNDNSSIEFKRKDVMAFSGSNFRFMNLFSGYTIKNINGMEITTTPLNPLVFIAVSEGVYNESIHKWIVQSVKYYCAGRRVACFILNLIDYLKNFENYLPFKKQFLFKMIHDGFPPITSKEVESLFLNFYNDHRDFNNSNPLLLTDNESRILEVFKNRIIMKVDRNTLKYAHWEVI